MNRMRLVLVTALAVFVTTSANAELVQYNLGVDDYGELWIDGVLEAYYDGYAQGGDMTDVLDLAPGWHDIDIVIMNRWGSSSVGLYTVEGSDYTYVPREHLRSLDAAGSVVSGLRADYYDLDGTYRKTVYGEGPIAHTSGGDTGYRLGYYQGEYGDGTGDPWVGLWDTFQETLSGEIYVTPLPGVALLAILGLSAVGIKLRKYA